MYVYVYVDVWWRVLYAFVHTHTNRQMSIHLFNYRLFSSLLSSRALAEFPSYFSVFWEEEDFWINRYIDRFALQMDIALLGGSGDVDDDSSSKNSIWSPRSATLDNAGDSN